MNLKSKCNEIYCFKDLSNDYIMDVSYIDFKEKLIIGNGLNFIDIYDFSINDKLETKISAKEAADGEGFDS